MKVDEFLAAIGHEVEDVEEESFLLFSQDIPSANLGFVDPHATTLDVTVGDRDFAIHQSPTLLSSSRAGGTTGAVLWKITPLFAEWISSKSNCNNPNPLWTSSILTPSSTVVELGCGISGLVALALAPSVGRYVLTDQEYVHRLLRENLDANAAAAYRHQSRHHDSNRQHRKQQQRGGRRGGRNNSNSDADRESLTRPSNYNITFTPLDWELDDVPSTLKQAVSVEEETKDKDKDKDANDFTGFDVLISCDCIYNEALVPAFVRTCADICRLRRRRRRPQQQQQETQPETQNPTVCVIAQQQRSPDVFEAWLRAAIAEFRVWRVRDEVLGEKLRLGTGYVVHVLVLREKRVDHDSMTSSNLPP